MRLVNAAPYLAGNLPQRDFWPTKAEPSASGASYGEGDGGERK